MHEELTGYSKALYSSWFYIRPLRVLLDVGEGIALSMGKRAFGIRQVFVTHGHEDHVSGLPSLVNVRNMSTADSSLPLHIYYPRGDRYAELLREYVRQKQEGLLRFELKWTELTPGVAVPIQYARRQMRVVAFAVAHTNPSQSLGYRIEERRQSLRPPFQGLCPNEVTESIRTLGRDAVVEDIWHRRLAYSGDSVPLDDLEPVRDSETLLIDSTFLTAEDAAQSGHGHIDASFKTAAEAGVRNVILMHLSERYTLHEIISTARSLASRHAFLGRASLLFEGRHIMIQ